jgi:hypothetical protein
MGMPGNGAGSVAIAGVVTPGTAAVAVSVSAEVVVAMIKLWSAGPLDPDS